jgi:hypothetical protein
LNLNNVGAIEGLRAISGALSYEVISEGSIYRIKRVSKQSNLEITWVDERLCIDVANYDLRTFLQTLSQKNGRSIVPSSTLNGEISGNSTMFCWMRGCALCLSLMVLKWRNEDLGV